MEAIYLLIPLSLVLVFAIGGVFWWALENGQFEDLEGPARRILLDDAAAEQSLSATIPVDADQDAVRSSL